MWRWLRRLLGRGEREAKPVKPLRVEGSCATCPCGERVEMPVARAFRNGHVPPKDVQERAMLDLRGEKVLAIMCPRCRAILALDEDLL